MACFDYYTKIITRFKTMISESIKTLLHHVSKIHVKNLRNADQLSTIEDLLISEEDDSLLDVTWYFEDGPFFYNISFRSKEAKPKKSIKGDGNHGKPDALRKSEIMI